jgi:hypothetical protein
MQQTPLSQLPEFSDSRSEPYGPDVFPDGFRAMTASEGDRLDAMAHVLLLDRALRRVSRWTVESYSHQFGWRLVQRHGGEVVDSVRLDVDDPDYWSDADIASGRERRGPEGDRGRVVAVVPISLTDLAPLIKASLYPLEAQDVLQELQDGRLNPWVASDGRYFPSDLDARQHQRTLDEKAAQQARRVAAFGVRFAITDAGRALDASTSQVSTSEVAADD